MREINAGALAGLIPCVVHDVLCRGHRVFGLAPPNRRHETFHGAPIRKRYRRGGAFRCLKFGIFSPRLFGYRHLRVPRSLETIRTSESNDCQDYHRGRVPRVNRRSRLPTAISLKGAPMPLTETFTIHALQAEPLCTRD